MPSSSDGRTLSCRPASTAARACRLSPAWSNWRGAGSGADQRQEGSRVMREVVLDTETTGLDPTSGHRIVEIACFELINHIPTGRSYQRYINPERDIPADATAFNA